MYHPRRDLRGPPLTLRDHGSREPSWGCDEPVFAAAQGQSRRLVGVVAGGLRGGAPTGRSHPVVGGLQQLPLVANGMYRDVASFRRHCRHGSKRVDAVGRPSLVVTAENPYARHERAGVAQGSGAMGAMGIRTRCLLRWTSRSNASSDIDPSLPNPLDLRLLPRIEPLPRRTLPDSLEPPRSTSNAISADFPVRLGTEQTGVSRLRPPCVSPRKLGSTPPDRVRSFSVGCATHSGHAVMFRAS